MKAMTQWFTLFALLSIIPRIAAAQEPVVFEAHQDQVNAVAFTPDGRRIVSASADGTVRIWDVTQSESERVMTARGKILCVAISADGTRIAAGTSENEIHVWNLLNGKRQKTLRGHRGAVTGVVYTADGKTLVSGSADGTIRLWNPVTAKTKRSWKAHKEGVGGLTLSADGRRVISVVQGKAPEALDRARAIVWNLANGAKVSDLENPGRGVHSQVAVSADGNWVAAISGDSGVAVFRDRTGEHKTTLLQNEPTAVALSADGNLVAIGGADGSITTFNPWTEKNEGSYAGHEKSITSLAFSADGKSLTSASADNTVRLWEVGQTVASAGGAEATPTAGAAATAPAVGSMGMTSIAVLALGAVVVLLNLLFQILYIIDALTKRDLAGGAKVLWALIILFTGLIGCIVYYFAVKSRVPLRAAA